MSQVQQEARVDYDALIKVGEAITYILLGGSAWAAKQKLERKISTTPPSEAERGSHPVDLLNAKMDHMLECVSRAEGQSESMRYEIDVLTKGFRRLTAQVEALERAHRAGPGFGESKSN